MGLGAFAVAQTPSSSPPVLPDLPAPSNQLALPDLPTLAPAPAKATSAAKPPSAPKPDKAITTVNAPPPALPDLPTATPPAPAPVAAATPAKADTKAEATKTEPAPDLAAAPAKLPVPDMPITTQPLPDVNTTATADPDLIVNPSADAQAQADAAKTPPSLPGLELPVPPVASAPTTALPEISVEAEKPKAKTWETKLAKTATYPETNFHYRRVLLPGNIYATEYGEQNQHLPKRMTRQDYENLLFYSATRNDINAMRALINQGTDMNAKDVNGSSVLQVARASGAGAAVKYLLARGAKS